MVHDSWSRLAPPAAVVKILSTIRRYAFLLLYFLYRTMTKAEDASLFGNLNLFFDFLLNVLPAFIIILVGIMEYRKFQYRLSPENLRIKQGWLRKEKKVIPIDKIQSVQIEQNLLFRYLNIYLVKIDTIGESEIEVEIGGITRSEALRIQERIQQLKQQDTVIEETEEKASEDPEQAYIIPMRQVTRYALTENLLWVGIPFVLCCVLLYRIYQDIDLASLDFGLILSIIFGNYESLGSGSQSTQITYFLLYGLMLGTFSSAMVFINRITGLFNFKLFFRSKEIFISRGLFNRFETIIPLRKIQYVTWYSNWLRKRLGIFTFSYKFSGSRRTLGADAIVPFFSEDQVSFFIKPYHPAVLDFPSNNNLSEIEPTEGEEITDNGIFVTEQENQIYGISTAYQWRNFLWVKLPFCIVLAAIAYGVHPYLLAFVSVLPIYFIIHNHWYVKHFKIQLNPEEIIIQKGVWGTRTIILRWEKIQKVTLRQTPYQRRHQLVNVVLGTASSAIQIPYLTQTLGEAMKDYGLYKTEISRQPLF